MEMFRARRELFSCTFGTNKTQQLREGQLVGRMLLQRLATGATGVKQARYRQRGTRTHMRSIHCVLWSLALAVQYETKCCLHPVHAYEFRRTLVLFIMEVVLYSEVTALLWVLIMKSQ